MLQALRAGIIKPSTAYQFALEPSFKSVQISNNQSGNFCMVRNRNAIAFPSRLSTSFIKHLSPKGSVDFKSSA